jgi:hypothetical protein
MDWFWLLSVAISCRYGVTGSIDKIDDDDSGGEEGEVCVHDSFVLWLPLISIWSHVFRFGL